MATDQDHPRESLDALAIAARQLQAVAPEDLLRQLVDMAVVSIPGCSYAGISTDRGGRPQSPVVSDPAVLRIDSMQYEINTGPCVEAMRGPEVFVDAPDLERDPRFGTFGPKAATAGCRAVLAHRLYVDSQTLGSLNLYSDTANGYTDDDRRHSVVLAALASLALNAQRLDADGEGLREAVRTRDLIGQAKGILMANEGLSEEEAFERLRETSSRDNRKLRLVAEDVIDTRDTTGRSN